MQKLLASEGVFQAREGSSVAAVGRSLVEESRIRDARFGNTEVSRIREIEEVRTKLQTVALANIRVDFETLKSTCPTCLHRKTY